MILCSDYYFVCCYLQPGHSCGMGPGRVRAAEAVRPHHPPPPTSPDPDATLWIEELELISLILGGGNMFTHTFIGVSLMLKCSCFLCLLYTYHSIDIKIEEGRYSPPCRVRGGAASWPQMALVATFPPAVSCAAAGEEQSFSAEV